MTQTTRMTECLQFEGCDAPLCPLDDDISSRIWYLDEPVCIATKHRQHRWIRKQRLLKRSRPKSYIDKVITQQMLYDVSRPKQLSEEQRSALRERIKVMHQAKRTWVFIRVRKHFTFWPRLPYLGWVFDQNFLDKRGRRVGRSTVQAQPGQRRSSYYKICSSKTIQANQPDQNLELRT